MNDERIKEYKSDVTLTWFNTKLATIAGMGLGPVVTEDGQVFSRWLDEGCRLAYEQTKADKQEYLQDKYPDMIHLVNNDSIAII